MRDTAEYNIIISTNTLIPPMCHWYRKRVRNEKKTEWLNYYNRLSRCRWKGRHHDVVINGTLDRKRIIIILC